MKEKILLLASDNLNTPSKTSLNTPINNRKKIIKNTEIIITDPTHPLFNRKFLLLSRGSKVSTGMNVYVKYRDHELKIPFSCTNLADRQNFIASKLTWASIYDLVSLFKEYGTCHAQLKNSGNDCQTT